MSSLASPSDVMSPADMSQNKAAIIANSTKRVLSLFNKYGSKDYIGEPMSIAEHSVQTAAAALAGNEKPDAALSCFLHDVGHLLGLESGNPVGMDGCGTADHEKVGADFLGKLGFSDTVAFLTRHHVNAKRYLCATDPAYYASLTEASKITLKHQGGVMSAKECKELEADPRWQTVLRMRRYDEKGKDPTAKKRNPDDFVDMIRADLSDSLSGSQAGKKYPVSKFASSYVLSDEQLRFFDDNGYLVIENGLDKDLVAQLSKLSDEVAAYPKSDKSNNFKYPWMVHHEKSKIDGKTINICRVENYCKNHDAWGKICFGIVQDLVSQAYRSEAILFKDKLNFKGPGGGNFLCHQDATAYSTGDLAKRHISVMVAIDKATPDNGPLQVTPGRHREGIIPNEAGVVLPDIEAKMKFIPVLANPGDIVLFDSYLPHRSDANMSNGWRRLAYLTFNMKNEGDFHSQYYAKKMAMMKEGNAGSISINKDFGGEVL